MKQHHNGPSDSERKTKSRPVPTASLTNMGVIKLEPDHASFCNMEEQHQRHINAVNGSALPYHGAARTFVTDWARKIRQHQHGSCRNVWIFFKRSRLNGLAGINEDGSTEVQQRVPRCVSPPDHCKNGRPFNILNQLYATKNGNSKRNKPIHMDKKALILPMVFQPIRERSASQALYYFAQTSFAAMSFKEADEWNFHFLVVE